MISLSYLFEQEKISFPDEEIQDLSKRSKIYTTRVDKEFGKYKLNHTYLSPWGDLLKVIDIKIYTNIKDHPNYNELTNDQIGLISKYKKFEVITLEKLSNDLNQINQIISTFNKQDKEFMGPRSFYNPSEFRRIYFSEDVPVAYFEARFIPNNIAKINMGVSSKCRKQGFMKNLFDKSVSELSKLGMVKLIAAINERNLPSLGFIKKVGFKEITDKNKLQQYRFNDSDHRYFEKRI